MPMKTLLVVVSVLALAFAKTSLAAPITYDFTGTTNTVTGEFVGEGSAVTGFIRFDDGLTDGNPSASVAQFNKLLAANAPLAATFEFSLTVGSVTKTSTGDVTSSAFLQAFDDAPNDDFDFTMGTFSLSGLSIGGGSAINIPANTGFSDIADIIAMMDGLDPGDFTTNTNSFWNDGTTANSVNFTWQTLTRVPEPSTALLLGLAVVALIRRRS